MKGLRNWYLPLGSVHRRWTGLFLFSTILLVLGLAAPAAAQMPPSCTETDAAITTTIQKLGLPDTTDATNLVADCTTLLRLKDELRDTGSLNWDTTIPMWSGVQSIGSWDGILVSVDSIRVIELLLQDKSLDGDIPAALADLGGLITLDLRDNQLGDDVTDLNLPTTLTILRLSNTGLTGTIPALSQLTELTLLELNNNGLTGTIPDLSQLTKLDRVYLSNNELSGQIPSLSQLAEMRVLDLSNNELSGQIPPLSGLAALEELFLWENQLTGPIPASLNELTRLWKLSLSLNQLSGPIPDLSNLDNLEIMYLRNNQLTGPIPASLGGLDALRELSLRNNQLSGPIPAALGDLTTLQSLYLNNNRLEGEIPDLSRLTTLYYLYLSDNDLSGDIPSTLGSLDSLIYLTLNSNPNLTGPIPSTWGSGTHPLPNLTRLYLYDTNWTGTYPTDIPQALRDKAGLDLLTNRQPSPPEVTDTAFTSGEMFTYTVEFYDPDGADTLTYHATLADGTVLPTTLPADPDPEPGDLAFDPTTQSLSGIPPAAGSVIAVTVSVTDEEDSPDPPTVDNPFCHSTRTSTNPPPFCAAVTVVIAPSSVSPNRPPTGPTIPAQVATRGGSFRYVVPAFDDPDGQTLTYRATQADGSALPVWLAFNTETRTFSGTPPTTGRIEIRVTATDNAYPPYQASVTFSLTVRAPVTRPPVTRPPPTGGGGGGGGGGSRDRHGNTPARATQVQLGESAPWTASTTGQINTSRDIDYFRLTVPHAGVLVVETTGSTDTVGTVWQDDEELDTADSGGTRRNFRLSVRVEAGPVVVAVEGNGTRTGAYTFQTILLVGFLENPGAGSFQSGIGVLSGWVCEGDEVVIELNGVPQPAAYGTARLDTQTVCGDTDNGFGLLFNWNLLGDGAHTVVALVDGVELSRTTVTVTTLGEEFVRDVAGECKGANFPKPGETVTLVWQETSQNFVVTGERAPTGDNRTGVAGMGFLENPGPNSFQSGIGVISGWVCEADEVIIALNGVSQPAGYGTARLDTQTVCGDTDNGFGLLFNWNLLGDGVHTVVAVVDGTPLGWATVRVTTVGEGAEEEFLRGAKGECVVEDFPMFGETVTLEWQQNSQNFVITEVE